MIFNLKSIIFQKNLKNIKRFEKAEEDSRMPLLISCVSHSYSSSDSNFANSSSHFSKHFKPGDRRTDPRYW